MFLFNLFFTDKSTTLNNSLQIQTYSLICSNKISSCIENLDKNRLPYIDSRRINYVANNIFSFGITTKQLKIIHFLIAKSKKRHMESNTTLIHKTSFW